MTRSIAMPMINSPTLANTLSKIKPRLDGYKQQLDNLTSDIREVENFIRASGIGEEFHFTVVNWAVDPEETINQLPKTGGSFSDSLSWEKWDESRTFRLVHRLYAEDDFSEFHVVFSKPLLESSVNTRKRVFPYLNSFLEELSEAVSVKDVPKQAKSSLFNNTDIPF